MSGHGLRLEDFEHRIAWNDLWDYVSEILREPSSHLVSAMNGDLYVPHPAERAAWAVFEQWVNTQLGRGHGVRKIKRPWAGTRPSYTTGDTPQERDDRAGRRKRLAELF